MKKILFLGAPVFQIPIIEDAKKMGLYVGVVDIDSDAPAKPYADKVYEASIIDYEQILEIAKDFKPDGIICGACDTSVVTCAKVCETLGLPGNSVESAIKSTDKLEMLKAFEKNAVPHPKFQFVDKTAIKDFELEIPYPVIAKPVDSAGGRGINFIENEKELVDKICDSSKEGKNGNVLVEEYMEGPEVSVEVIVCDGVPHVLQITDKITSGEPYFYEIGHSQPSDLADDIKSQITKTAEAACMAVGLVNSPAHVEIKVTDEGPKLVELGARMGGDCITTYLINASILGVSMSEEAIRISLGEKRSLGEYRESGIYSAVKFIPSCTGTLKKVIVDQNMDKENVLDIHISVTQGTNYSDARDDTGRFGYVVAKGSSRQEALERCQNIIDAIKFVVDK